MDDHQLLRVELGVEEGEGDMEIEHTTPGG